jgi:hypothetical protein
VADFAYGKDFIVAFDAHIREKVDVGINPLLMGVLGEVHPKASITFVGRM